MKTKIVTAIATIAISLGFYQTAFAQDSYTVQDYFPLTENYHAWFEGDGIEFSSFDVYFDYIEDDYVQTRTVSGTSMLEIYQVTEDTLYLWYQEPEMYDPDNYIPDIKTTADVPVDVPLQAPLEVGNYWGTASGDREIVEAFISVDINGTTYHDVIVVREYPDYDIPEDETVEMYKYYAPGVGLIQDYYYSEVEGQEPFTVTSVLHTLDTSGNNHQTVVVDNEQENDTEEESGTEEDDGTEEENGTEEQNGTEEEGTEEDNGTEESNTEEENTEENGTEEIDGPLASDYFPLTDNYHAFFEGEGIEYATYERYFDFIDDDYVQTRTISGTSLVEIFQATDEAVYQWYAQPEIYVRENFISRVRSQADEPLDVLIQTPIEVGNYWETETGAREIVSIDETVEVGDETYEDVLVIEVYQDEETEQNEENQTLEYYAPGVGLVLEEFSSVAGEDEEPVVVTSTLDSIETDGWYETITVFVPDEEGMYLEPVEYELFTETDTFMRGEFASIFQGEHDGIPQIAPDGLTINFMYTHWNSNPSDNRLFVDFSNEITELRGSTEVLMTLEAMLHTIQNYYYGTDMIVTVENEPLHTDGIQFNEDEVYVPDESLINDSETVQ